MCPLVAAPSRGYLDYQRLDNRDTGILATIALNNSVGPVPSAITDVSRFECLGLTDAPGSGNVKVTVDWFNDALGTVLTGRYVFMLTSSIGGNLQMNIPNRGSYVQITLQGAGGVVASWTVFAFATNRASVLPAQPEQPLLLDFQGFPITAGANLIEYPTSYYGGPLYVWFVPASAGIFLQFQFLNIGGNWDIFTQTAAPGANVNQIQNVTVPLSAWRVLIATGGVNSTFYLTATPANTGAS